MEPQGTEGGRRRKLTRVTKKRAARVLKKLGLKLRGGGDDGTLGGVVPDPGATDGAAAKGALAPVTGGGVAVATGAAPVTGGRRRRGTKKAGRRHRRSGKMWPF